MTNSLGRQVIVVSAIRHNDMHSALIRCLIVSHDRAVTDTTCMQFSSGDNLINHILTNLTELVTHVTWHTLPAAWSRLINVMFDVWSAALSMLSRHGCHSLLQRDCLNEETCYSVVANCFLFTTVLLTCIVLVLCLAGAGSVSEKTSTFVYLLNS